MGVRLLPLAACVPPLCLLISNSRLFRKSRKILFFFFGFFRAVRTNRWFFDNTVFLHGSRSKTENSPPRHGRFSIIPPIISTRLKKKSTSKPEEKTQTVYSRLSNDNVFTRSVPIRRRGALFFVFEFPPKFVEFVSVVGTIIIISSRI